MKSLLLSITMLLSIPGFAEITKEFDEKVEKKCHGELNALGCVKADKESPSCGEKNKKKLSVECQAIHEAKKQK